MVVDTPCTQHEEIIQDHSRKIAELETRADYKEKMIDSLDDKIEKMDKKIDTLLDGFNDFKIESNHYDAQLELRLNTIETQIELQNQKIRDNKADSDSRVNRLFLVIGTALTVITIIVNVFMK
jgi:uncharacterized coiled-coil protein SlyX